MVEAGVRSGEAAPTMERSLFQQVLKLNHMLSSLYFELQGDGDLGATLPTADGRELRRLEQPGARRYLSVFGEHELTRYVYGSREDQRVEYIPLDGRLQLPKSKFSESCAGLAAIVGCRDVLLPSSPGIEQHAESGYRGIVSRTHNERLRRRCGTLSGSFTSRSSGERNIHRRHS
jgi:hypothetical protein